VNGNVEAAEAAQKRLHRLFEAAERNGGPYEVCDEPTFRFLLQEGGCQIGAIKNIPHGKTGYKTQCASNTNGSSRHFFIFTPKPVEWC